MAKKTVNNRDVGNTTYTQVEPLLTVQKLKETYLFGTTYFTDHEGNEISDEAIQTFINNAISMLEHDLDLAIMPRKKVEFKDYYANDYYDWGFMQLHNTPVISLESMRVVYLKGVDSISGEEKFEAVMDIPKSWIRLDPDAGVIRLIPNNKFPGRLAVDAGGAFFPEIFNRHTHVPHMWELTYYHGFKAGCVPSVLNSAIGLIASIYVMNILGDLIIGAGIAGTSLSIDGLSQSIQTTASAENHGLSARVSDYARQLYGDRTRGTAGIIEVLRRYYRGSNMSII